MLSQKDAVHKAVTSHKNEDGTFDRKTVIAELFQMYRAGEFAHGDPEKVKEDKALRDYCGSVLSNWLRKDSRLKDGAETSTPKTGRRKARPADDEMKRLMQAKVVLTTEGQSTQQIDDLIQQRSIQLNAEKSVGKIDAIQDAEDFLSLNSGQ